MIFIVAAVSDRAGKTFDGWSHLNPVSNNCLMDINSTSYVFTA